MTHDIGLVSKDRYCPRFHFFLDNLIGVWSLVLTKTASGTAFRIRLVWHKNYKTLNTGEFCHTKSLVLFTRNTVYHVLNWITWPLLRVGAILILNGHPMFTSFSPVLTLVVHLFQVFFNSYDFFVEIIVYFWTFIHRHTSLLYASGSKNVGGEPRLAVPSCHGMMVC